METKRDSPKVTQPRCPERAADALLAEEPFLEGILCVAGHGLQTPAGISHGPAGLCTLILCGAEMGRGCGALLPAGQWTTSMPGQAVLAALPGSAGSRAEAQMPTQGPLQAAGSCPSPALASGAVQTHGHSASPPLSLHGSVSFPSLLFDSQVYQERLGIELKLHGRGLAHKSRASRELMNSTKPGRRGRRPRENSQVPALRQSLHHPSARANPGCLQGACRDRGV